MGAAKVSQFNDLATGEAGAAFGDHQVPRARADGQVVGQSGRVAAGGVDDRAGRHVLPVGQAHAAG